AEDGIRDRNVTGVQTCALPIWKLSGLVSRVVQIRISGLARSSNEVVYAVSVVCLCLDTDTESCTIAGNRLAQEQDRDGGRCAVLRRRRYSTGGVELCGSTLRLEKG